MKIKNKDLKALYKSYIMEKPPYSRENCPSPKEILDFFRSKASEKQEIRIVDHITNYSCCTQEFEFVLEILRYEKKLDREIRKLLIFEREKSDVKKRKYKAFSLLRNKIESFIPRLSWKYVSIFAGVLLFASIVTFFIFKISGEREYRGINLTRINLIEPINKKYSKSLLIFKWSKMKDTDYYIVEIFDETLYPVWKSNRIIKNKTTLPIEISKKLVENKTYSWMVTAFFPNGNKIESRIEEFIVTK